MLVKGSILLMDTKTAEVTLSVSKHITLVADLNRIHEVLKKRQNAFKEGIHAKERSISIKDVNDDVSFPLS